MTSSGTLWVNKAPSYQVIRDVGTGKLVAIVVGQVQADSH